MPQQHAQFEEEFRDGPQPHVSYQDGYTEAPSASYTAPVPPPMQSYVSGPVQQPLAHNQNAAQQGSRGYGARATLAIFSILFVMIMFIVALIMHNMATPPPDPFASPPEDAYVFAGIFAVFVLIINLIVNRRR